MKARLLAVVVLLLSLTTASVLVAQTPAVTHNTWTSGSPMPTAVVFATAAVLKGNVYVVGGVNPNFSALTDTQIYDPATNTWSAGVPLPTPVWMASTAVVDNILYVIGGSGTETQSPTGATWAYNPKIKTWSSKADMPTARNWATAVVEDNIIYVIGGWGSSGNLATVESYNPATDTWTEEAPLLVGKWAPSSGLLGTKPNYTIVAPGGAEECCPSDFTGDNEGYNVTTNAWSSINSDPTARGFACYGSIGSKFYVAGGNDDQWTALGVTESFQLAKNAWKTLASVPQPTISPGSAVYKGRLYCIGGWDAWNGDILNNVQIYQP